jgi:2-amino-4-hydroxy-6-hydroxymethyldihydropteridine diphosphokinase
MNSLQATVFISLGTNLGDREKNLRDAIELLAQLPHTSLIKQSRIYTTAAWGKTDQPDFLNMVVAISSALLSQQLMESLLQLEEKMGRVRNDHWGPRIIDMDILFYGDEVVDSLTLRVPHPEMQHRNFVLVPLNEIAPELVHPVLKKSIAQLLEACSDKLTVLTALQAGISNG